MERHKSQQLSQIYRADDAEFQSASAPPRESAGLGLHARYGMGALMISIEVPWGARGTTGYRLQTTGSCGDVVRKTGSP